MSNLGAYQDFTTAAKAAGGVAQHIKNIEHAAVMRSAAPILLVGALVGWGASKVQARARASKQALTEEN